MTLSKERLEQYIRQPLENGLARGDIMQLAKMMLNQDDWNAAQQKVIDDLRVQLERRERDRQEPVTWGLFHFASGEFYNACSSQGAAERHLNQVHQSNDSVTLIIRPLYAAPPAPDIGDVRVGRLPTMNQDEYPGLGDWWVQLRMGEDSEEVLARVYGATPQEANNRAETLACRAAALNQTHVKQPASNGQSFGNSEQLNSPATPDCWCHTCSPVTMTNMRFVVCPDCGNKRCPKANDHRNTCSGSNEPGQDGSAYPVAPKQESE